MIAGYTSFYFTNAALWILEDMRNPNNWLKKIRGHKDYTLTQISTYGKAFKLVDCDGVWYFTGKILGDDNLLLPLDFYGESYGCLNMLMKNTKEQWVEINC